MCSHICVQDGHHSLHQRLAHLDINLTTQRQNHRREFLCERHHLLQVTINQLLVSYGERRQVYRRICVATAHCIQVAEDAIRDERSKRSRQLNDGLEAGVESLVCCQLILGHTTTPKTLTVQTYVPVREVLAHELLNHTSCGSGIVTLQALGHVLHQSIEQRDDPAVDLGTLLNGDLLLRAGETIDIGIEREEAISIVERTEELTTYLIDALNIEFQVIPRLRVRDHIPTNCISTILIHNLERIDGVTQTLRHLVTVLIEHQTVRNDILECYRVEQHRCDCVQREEPTTSLIDTLGDEVGGIYILELRATIFEGIVQLSIRHRTTIEPNVDQVGLAVHRLARRAHQHDIIYVGTVQVDCRVVLLRHIAHLELRVGILGHHARRNSLLDLRNQLLNRADALHLRAILRSPDRQRSTPEARTRQVPIVQILQPLTETAATGRFGTPADRGVELHHTLFKRGGADKPRIQRIVQYGLIRTPAVGIVVSMLLDAEGQALALQLHTDIDVERLGRSGSLLVVATIDRKLRIVGILHPATCILLVSLNIDALSNELLVEILQRVELTREINHRAGLATLVDHKQRRDTRSTSHECVISTERRRNVYDTRTVLGGYIVTCDHAESLLLSHLPLAALVSLNGLNPLDQLLVVDTYQISTLIATILLNGVGTLQLLVEDRGQQLASHDHRLRLLVVGIEALNTHVVDLGTNGQRSVRRQSPRSGRPSQEIELALNVLEQVLALLISNHTELSRAGCILHIAVATRLVQLVS